VADPDQVFWGSVKQGGTKNVFTCLNTQGGLRQSLVVTQKWLRFVGQKVAIFVCDFRRNSQFESVWSDLAPLMNSDVTDGGAGAGVRAAPLASFM